MDLVSVETCYLSRRKRKRYFAKHLGSKEERHLLFTYSTIRETMVRLSKVLNLKRSARAARFEISDTCTKIWRSRPTVRVLTSFVAAYLELSYIVERFAFYFSICKWLPKSQPQALTHSLAKGLQVARVPLGHLNLLPARSNYTPAVSRGCPKLIIPMSLTLVPFFSI